MNRLQGLALVLVGAVLILAPVVAHEVGAQVDKDRLMEFSRQNPVASAPTPPDLKPGGCEGYHWACFGGGAAVAMTGLGRFKSCGASHPEKWPTAPDV